MKAHPLASLPAAAALLALTASNAAADFTISGEARYVDRTFTYGAGFTGAEPERPIRKAKVQVLDVNTNAVLATGETELDGTFSFVVPGAGTQDIFLRVRSASDAFGGNNRLRCTDLAGAIYDLVTPNFLGWDLGTNLDVGVLVSTKINSNGKFGNPFNILDMMVTGIDYIKAQGESNPSSTLRINWPGGSGSFASGTTATMAEDDGYDDTVILHEFGHVIHNHFSDSDNPGGSHSFFESDQDPRLSLGEGYATFFAGAVRQFSGIFDPGIYVDANGNAGGNIQLRLRMENGDPFPTSIGGEADESAVVCALWDIVDTATTNDSSGASDDDALDGTVVFTGGIDGDRMMWDVLTGPVNTASNLTIRDFWNGYFVPLDYGQYNALSNTFRDWGMRFFLDNAEPNNSLGEAFTMTANGSWSGVRTLYYSPNDPPAPGDGDSDFYEFDLCAGSVFTVETRYHGNVSDAETYVDPFITVRKPDGTFVANDDDSGTGRNARLEGLVADVSGYWTVEVKTNHSYRRTGSYNVRVNVTQAGGGVCPCCPLDGDVATLSLSAGGTQAMVLDAGPAHAGKVYWMLGSVTGTIPGLPTSVGTLPLNFDGYFNFTLNFPNVAPLANSLSVLDGSGKANASFSLPPGSDPGLVGVPFSHAYLVLNVSLTDADFVSNAIQVVTLF